MKKILFAIIFALALSVSAFAQQDSVGIYGIYDRSDATEPKNAGGAGIFGIKNIYVNDFKFTVKNDFYGYSDQAFNSLGGGHVYRNEFKVRVPTDLKKNFAGVDSEVYVGGQAAVEHQAGMTTFTPSAIFGLRTTDNVFTEYHYVFPTGTQNVRGHQVSVEVYRTLEQNPKYFVYTGFTGFTGRFNPTPVTPEDLYNVKVFVGIGRKY